MIVSHGSGVRAVEVLRMSVGVCCGCFKCHRNVAVGAEQSLATLCDPGVQSHALDVSSLLLWFVRRPEELG